MHKKEDIKRQLNSIMREKGISLTGGYTGEALPMHIWESIGKCDPVRCPARERCTFPDKFPSTDKCHVQAQYLQTIYVALVKDYIHEMDEYKIAQIGFLLLPLYGHLIKFKIYELSVETHNMVKPGKGGYSVMPIYKEIRECIKGILSVSKDLFGASLKFNPSNVNGIALEDTMQNGDPTWYQDMQKAIQESARKGSKSFMTKSGKPMDVSPIVTGSDEEDEGEAHGEDSDLGELNVGGYKMKVSAKQGISSGDLNKIGKKRRRDG